MTKFSYEIVDKLKSGLVEVIPTDTLYGIVGSALNPQTVEKIYDLRRRSKDKPMIILISGLDDLNQLGIDLNESDKKLLNQIWPNPVSVILPCHNPDMTYLHRGKNTLAVRMPKDEELLNLLKQTGPLVAPSANFEGEPPAQNVTQAKKYFADQVAFYIDGGDLISQPSTLIELTNRQIKVLRQGLYRLENL